MFAILTRLALLSLVVGAPLAAQPTSRPAPAALAHVQVAPIAVTRAAVHAAAQDTAASIPWPQPEWQRALNATATGAVIGLVVGAGVGAALAARDCSDDCGLLGPATALSGVVNGAFYGGLAGAGAGFAWYVWRRDRRKS